MALLIYDNGLITNPPARMLTGERNVEEAQAVSKDKQFDHANQLGKALSPLTGEHSALLSGRSRIYLDTERESDSLKERRKLQALHIMSSPVITITPSTSISSAWQTIDKAEIDHLVVVGPNLQPISLVNSTQLIQAGTDSEEAIASLLTHQVAIVTTDTLVRDIAQFFIDQKITALQVVSIDEHRLVGIISRSDLLKLLVSGPNVSYSV
ncbi:HPP family protein [Nitrincola sp.]|uniref:CBS domain-containing protein n=1 Tax=Nitrincola sp. TaxID=1926584 RepID=UPI003A9248E1